MEFWVIKVVQNEYHSGYEYITTTLEDAEAHRMDHCGWYCQRGDVELVKIDQNFKELERIDYWQGKVWEHVVMVFEEGKEPVEKYIIKKGKKVRK